MRAGQHWLWGLLIVGVLAGVVVAQRALRDDPGSSPVAENDGEGAHPPGNGTPTGTPENGEREATAPKPKTLVEWETSWRVAKQRASAEDKLVFLYVGLKPATCPPCRVLESELFVDQRIAALNELVVPLYIRLDHSAGSAERGLLQRIQVGTLPLLALITVEGGVVHRQRGGLYRMYRTNYQASDAPPPEGTLDAAELVAIVRREVRNARRVTSRMDALSKATEVAELGELAELLVGRERFGAAIETLQRSLRTQDAAATRARLAGVLRQAGRRTESAAAYEAALASAAEHPERLAWRLDLARVRIEILAAESEARLDAADMERELDAIIKAAAAAKRADLEAGARGELAAHEQSLGRASAVATQLDWFREHYLDGPAVLGSTLRWQIAHVAHAASQLDDAVAHLRRLASEHPGSAPAQLMKHGTLDAWVREAEGE